MFSKLGTKIALQRAGLGNVSLPSLPKSESNGGGGGGDSTGAGFQNPFANVQWGVPKAFQSWQTPPPPANAVREPPAVGSRAQSNVKLKFPAIDGRPCIVFFLRYCGCPFSEKLFLALRSLSNRHPGIHFIAISHCTPAATDAWVKKLGGAWNVDVVVDQTRELYALWGLGISNWGHLLHPRNGYNQVLLGRKEGVWGSPVGDGGCRWQTGGVYAVDEKGVVQWGGPMKSVDELIEFEDGVKALGFRGPMQSRTGVF
ncbi:hypothetical protein BU24DRAFT_418588 [Aaosphaeria arxii CBS 175.79]|uniref:Thioredoxin domain-containing protein n=1 Tax=Aaosphaeria arxii CBS 175.79 TaxID=1450172 RepID=A0A6A5Y348_9PLEO|nr:uncharacterized protein BU24DRAFT_418588 [Aaosphaeria arxii CBS 175.79]KAF2019004.1 hypothetical protein BU24DRAFT_418588 [Aaosphaeria arxii CBS 175.79]